MDLAGSWVARKLTCELKFVNVSLLLHVRSGFVRGYGVHAPRRVITVGRSRERTVHAHVHGR